MEHAVYRNSTLQGFCDEIPEGRQEYEIFRLTRVRSACKGNLWGVLNILETLPEVLCKVAPDAVDMSPSVA